jgi:hypothetical protein
MLWPFSTALTSPSSFSSFIPSTCATGVVIHVCIKSLEWHWPLSQCKDHRGHMPPVSVHTPQQPHAHSITLAKGENLCAHLERLCFGAECVHPPQLPNQPVHAAGGARNFSRNSGALGAAPMVVRSYFDGGTLLSPETGLPWGNGKRKKAEGVGEK